MKDANISGRARAGLVVAMCAWTAAGAGAQSVEPLADALQRKIPAFGDSFISTIKVRRAPQGAAAPFDPEETRFLSAAAAPGRTLAPTATPEVLAHLYLDRALSSPDGLSEACAFLDRRGEAGREAKARLLGLAPAASGGPSGSAAAAAGLAKARASAASLQSADWNQARPIFDGGASQGDAVIAAAGIRTGLAPAALAGRTPAPAPAPGAAEDKNEAGVVRLVSISMEKLQELALNKDPGERKLQLEKPFGLGASPLSGAGVFTSKKLSPEEIAADPVKKAAAADAAKNGAPVDFLRTNAKVQLFGTVSLPIDIPGNPGELNVGLRKGGVVEIVQTRPVRQGEADAHPDRQAFLWPLTVEHLKKVMKVGEDFTLTGRIEGAGAVVGGIGQGIDFPYYGGINAKVEAGVGAAHDGWISLHVNKIDDDHVRVSLQEGDGTALRAHVELSAGLDLNSDDFIPHVPPSNLDESMVGKAVALGEDSLFQKIEDLGKAELTAEFRKSKHDLRTEGWASVSLSDPQTSAALEQFFKVHPKALRSLPAEATRAEDLGAGRLNAEVRDVTREHELEAHLSFLHITKSGGSTYYEVRWRQDDGQIARKLVVVGESEFEENINKTSRAQESVMWFDLGTGEASISVKLGPQERKLTTTREHINDVIALQKAFGLTLETAKIDEPHPYLQFFGLGNYGRSSESGQFVLHNEGIQALKKADRDSLAIAYLRADWLFEKESFPPGGTWSEDQAPAWAAASDAAALRPVVDFLRANGARSISSSGKSGASDYAALQSRYARLAPGRSLRGDAWRMRAADTYAGHVRKMQDSGSDPAQLLRLFLKFRHDGAIELKRSVVATAALAGRRQDDGQDVPNVDAYIEMTGKRVTLKPKAKPVQIPDSPVDEIQDVLKQWQ